MRIDPDDPLKALEAALEIEPSPEFAAKVRARVAAEARRSPFPGWGWAFVGLAAAASVMLAVAVWPRAHRVEIVSSSSAPVVASTSPQAGVPPVNHEATRGVLPVKRAVGTPRGVRTGARRAEPEVLVSGDEKRALDRLLLAVREGRATVPAALPGPPVDEDGHLLDPAPLAIPSLTIRPLPGTPVDGSGRVDR